MSAASFWRSRSVGFLRFLGILRGLHYCVVTGLLASFGPFPVFAQSQAETAAPLPAPPIPPSAPSGETREPAAGTSVNTAPHAYKTKPKSESRHRSHSAAAGAARPGSENASKNASSVPAEKAAASTQAAAPPAQTGSVKSPAGGEPEAEPNQKAAAASESAASPSSATAMTKGSASGLPLPRFAALRADEVNLRAGPGTRYPIDWVYKRRNMPVEIEREFDVWRLIRDPDGVRGWVHQATLTGRRTFMVTGSLRVMREKPDENAAPVAKLQPGVIGQILHCDAASDWCEVRVRDYRGYLKREEFWGTLPNEAIN